MPDYAKTAASAAKSIAKAGKAYTLTRTAVAFNNATGETVSTTTATGTIQAVILPATKKTIEGFETGFAGPLVLSKVKYILAAAGSFVPELLDEIEIQGSVYSIRWLSVLSPSGVDIIYKMGAMLK